MSVLTLNIETETEKLQTELDCWFLKLQSELEKQISNELKNKIQLLSTIRVGFYENLNQYQHKALLIESAKILQNMFPQINKWSWHPAQTSHVDFGDLTGYVDGKIYVNAEATTSLEPLGTIDKTMIKTLSCLNNKKEGLKFYFVKTNSMHKQAITKIKKTIFIFK
jgi:flagellar hook protein FlgE